MSELQVAIDLIQKGDVVGMPTETVYGLAGSIYSEAAIRKIFALKERPFFDPLIVHVAQLEDVKLVAREFPPVAEFLAKTFWPGPLTLILPKKDELNPMITSGLDQVGVRMPNHPLALELIKNTAPLAAPSANKFKKTSPSEAEHVFNEFGENLFVLDGGKCQVGIESTVIGFQEKKVLIYRPGMIDLAKLAMWVKSYGYTVEYAQSPVAPGQLEHHYMPKVPLYILGAGEEIDPVFNQPKELKLSNNPNLAARELYAMMRELCEEGADALYIYRTPLHDGHEWRGIWDRLTKASTRK